MKKVNTHDQVIEIDKKENNFIKELMRKRYLSKVSTSNGYKEHNDPTMISEVLEISKTPSIIDKKIQPINSLADDSNLWWSSSDDEK